MSGRNRAMFRRTNMQPFQGHSNFSANHAQFYAPEAEILSCFEERGAVQENCWPLESSRTIVFDEGVRRWPSEAPQAPYQPSNSSRIPEWSDASSLHHWSSAHHWSAESATKAFHHVSNKYHHQWSLNTSSHSSRTNNFYDHTDMQKDAKHLPPPANYHQNFMGGSECRLPQESFRASTFIQEMQSYPMSNQPIRPQSSLEEPAYPSFSQSFRPSERFVEGQAHFKPHQSFGVLSHAEEQVPFQDRYHWSAKSARKSRPFNAPLVNNGMPQSLVPPICLADNRFIHAPPNEKKGKKGKSGWAKAQKTKPGRKKQIQVTMESRLPLMRQQRTPKPISKRRLGRLKWRLKRNRSKWMRKLESGTLSDKKKDKAILRIDALESRIEETMARKRQLNRDKKLRKIAAAKVAARAPAVKAGAAVKTEAAVKVEAAVTAIKVEAAVTAEAAATVKVEAAAVQGSLKSESN